MVVWCGVVIQLLLLCVVVCRVAELLRVRSKIAETENEIIAEKKKLDEAESKGEEKRAERISKELVGLRQREKDLNEKERFLMGMEWLRSFHLKFDLSSF